ncbi:unnamed protein product [Orchesella dallaii]
MTLDRWKGVFGIVELILLITSGIVLQGCQAQDSGGSNFFYYYSPTQRTHVSQTFGQTQAPSNPFLNRIPTNSPPLIGYPPLESTSIQPIQSNNAAPQQYIYRTPAGTTYSPLPALSQFRFGLPQQPFQNYQVGQDESQRTASTTSFSTFNRFGKDLFTNNAQLPPSPQPQPLLTNQRARTTVQPQPQSRGTYSFFESPFQYIQERQLEQLQTPATTPAPLVTSTSAPNVAAEYLEADEGEAVRRKPKYSSRFRYVEPQVNPYSHITSYTSDLPYTERRYYSTVIPSSPTPTGYAFSIGSEDGSGPKASVHVSMGPLSNTQHLTEITGSQFLRPRQSFNVPSGRRKIIPEVANIEGQGVLFQMAREDIEESSSTTPKPAVVEQTSEDVPQDLVANVNSTVETLIKEPSVQTETIASQRPELPRNLDDINIPQRLGKRRKVARKRLQIDDPEDIGTEYVSEGRRRLSPNRLPESPKEVNDLPKGLPAAAVPSSTESQSQLDSISNKEQQEFTPQTPPEENFPLSSTSSSVEEPPSPVQSPFTEASPPIQENEPAQPAPAQKQEDYYEYDNANSGSRSSKETENSGNEDEAPVPILIGVNKEDYPGVFNDNSLETDRGEILTRHKTSQPAVASVSTTENMSGPASVEDSREPQLPSVDSQPISPPISTTTEQVSVPTLASTSTTEQTPIDSQEQIPTLVHEDSVEHSPDSPVQEHSQITTTSSTTPSPPSTTTTTTELPELEVPHFEVIEGVQPNKEVEIENIPSDNISLQNDNENSGSSTSTISPGDNDGVNIPEDTSPTSPPEDINPASESAVPSGEQQPSSENPRNDIGVDAEVGASPSSTTQVTPSATSTEPIISTTESEFDDFGSQEVLPDEEHEIDEVTSDEQIGKAQRLALQESLQRLRQRQRNDTTSSPIIDDPVNSTIAVGSGGRRRSRHFIRKPLQLANLTLPTSGPLPNQNALFEDDDVDHSRSQVIEKIQKFRANVRRVSSTTTKRPRRVTRPSSERVGQKVKLDQVELFSNSSSAGVDPYIPRRSFTRPNYDISTTESFSSTTESFSSTRIPLPETTTVTTTTEESETEFYPFPPTTTTTTDAPVPVNRIMEPTTEGTTVTTTESTTTLTSRTTLPSTTASTTTDFAEESDLDKEDYILDQVQEPKFIPYEYNTPSTTSSTTYSETEGVSLASTTPITPTTTTVTTTVTTEVPDIPTGQLIIHEILPTQPPLKEVSFVVGESVEDEEGSKSQEESQSAESQEKPPISTVVRVEANVEISSSISKSEQTSKKSNNETISTDNGDNAKPTPPGKKVRVVIVRQRKAKQVSSSNGEVRRRRRIMKLAHS